MKSRSTRPYASSCDAESQKQQLARGTANERSQVVEAGTAAGRDGMGGDPEPGTAVAPVDAAAAEAAWSVLNDPQPFKATASSTAPETLSRKDTSMRRQFLGLCSTNTF